LVKYELETYKVGDAKLVAQEGKQIMHKETIKLSIYPPTIVAKVPIYR